MCAGLDAEVDAFCSRPLEATGHPYVSLDALYHKVREGGRVVSMATLIAMGISATGERTVLGVEVAAAGGDEGAHWLPFLRSLTARGLTGVRLVISDAHPRLVAAVEATFLGPARQRRRVPATRNALGLVAKAARGMVAGAIRSIFEQPDEASAGAQLRRVPTACGRAFPKVAELLERAEDDLLAHFTFPPAHRRQIRSTNPGSDSTTRSADEPTWSGSSPIGAACSGSSGASSPSRTTNGPSGGIPSVSSRCRC